MSTTIPLPHDEAQTWLARAREAIQAFPVTIDGPYGEPVLVSVQGDHVLFPTASVERARDRQMIPTEIEVAPGCIVPLAEVRVYFGEPPQHEHRSSTS